MGLKSETQSCVTCTALEGAQSYRFTFQDESSTDIHYKVVQGSEILQHALDSLEQERPLVLPLQAHTVRTWASVAAIDASLPKDSRQITQCIQVWLQQLLLDH